MILAGAFPAPECGEAAFQYIRIRELPRNHFSLSKEILAPSKNSVPNEGSQRTVFLADPVKEQYRKMDISRDKGYKKIS
jgi:hypothetical protein